MKPHWHIKLRTFERPGTDESGAAVTLPPQEYDLLRPATTKEGRLVSLPTALAHITRRSGRWFVVEARYIEHFEATLV